MTRINRALGLALALMYVMLFGAFAHPAFADPASAGGRMVLVTPSALNGGYRPAHQGDNDIGLVPIEKYNEMARDHPGMVSVDQALSENGEVCGDTGGDIREAIAIAFEAKDMGHEWDSIRKDLIGLGKQEVMAKWGRRAGEVGSTVLLCLIPGVNLLYCGGAAAGNFGNEMQGIAHDKANAVNLHATDLSARQSQLQLRATLLYVRQSIAWAKLVHVYCLNQFRDQTLGADTSSPAPAANDNDGPPTDWGYWNERQASHR